jgi:GH24 family phage-related lysozyme (muramidase)
VCPHAAKAGETSRRYKHLPRDSQFRIGVSSIRHNAGCGFFKNSSFFRSLLGKAYMQGAEQLPRDPVQGGMWLRLAAKENKQFYLDELHSAERQMTPAQVGRATALADEWKPKPPATASLPRNPAVSER